MSRILAIPIVGSSGKDRVQCCQLTEVDVDYTCYDVWSFLRVTTCYDVLAGFSATTENSGAPYGQNSNKIAILP